MNRRLKTKKFWISLAGMVIMFLQLLGVKIDVPYVNEIINSVCAICVFIGLLDGGSQSSEDGQETEDEQKEQSDNQDEKIE